MKEGAKYHQGQTYAIELVVAVVRCASVSLLALRETLTHVLVMANSPLVTKFASVLDLTIISREREMTM